MLWLHLKRACHNKRPKLIEVAKKEVMLSFEAQLAEMVNELSDKVQLSEKAQDVQVANTEQVQEHIDSDIE